MDEFGSIINLFLTAIFVDVKQTDHKAVNLIPDRNQSCTQQGTQIVSEYQKQ